MIMRNATTLLKEASLASGLALTEAQMLAFPFGSGTVTPARALADLTGLVGAIARKDRAGRLQQDLHIEHRRPYSGILQIQPDHLIKRRLASPVHLPQSGNARPRLEQAPPVPDIIGLQLVRNRRPRSNQGHLAFQDIPELGNLIEAGAPHNSADPGNTRIVGELVGYFCFGVATRGRSLAGDKSLYVFFVDRSVRRSIHRPKFQKLKRNAIPANALLPEEYGACGSERHQNGQQQKHR